MSKQNITGYTDQELSLLVFNDESLYVLRHKPGFIEDVIKDCFTFTNEQLAVLEVDLLDDAQGMNDDGNPAYN